MSVCRVVMAAALIGVLAGCQSTATGTPTPETTSSSPTSDRLVPPIENPKDIRGMDPCEMLTANQLAELTQTEPGKRDKSAWGEDTCRWFSSTLSVALDPDTQRGGLEHWYQVKENFKNFEPTEVDGYPAARANFATQFCSVVVGVADDQALVVHYGLVGSDAPGEDDPCSFNESIASMVLKNLPDA